MDLPATSDNIPGTLVLRDASGNLSAGTVAADLTGDLMGNVTGDVTGNVTGDLTGNVAGDLTGNVTGDVTGNVTGDLTGDVTGNSSTATALQTSRTIELTGDVTGSASFNGTANASISANISSGVIVDADIKSDAAIAGTKIAPDFGSQIVTTSGDIDISSDSGAIIRPSSSSDGNASDLRFVRSRGTQAAKTVVQVNNALGRVRFYGYDGASALEAARISADVDGAPGANDMPGRLIFSTTADGGSSPTERVRINSAGSVLIGTTAEVDVATGTEKGFTYTGGSAFPVLHLSLDNGAALRIRRRVANGAVAFFHRDTTAVGSISVTTTATAFNTSSDYRLKQNVEPMTGGLAKLAALAPKTFEFKSEPGVKVDGFIAHEVQEVVPIAVTGEKDGEEMQGLDHSKLVPVLVAAVQELSAKVAALESALELK